MVFLAAIIVLGYFVFAFKGLSAKRDFSFLKNGDLVLRRGRSIESFAVYILDKNRDYSHIGIVKVVDTIAYIIHVVPDKPGFVLKELPIDFLSDKNTSHFEVIRSDFTPDQLKAVTDTALRYYNSHFTFDYNYDLGTDTSLYCTELIVKAFEKSNIYFPDIVPQQLNLLVGTFNVIMPGSFLKNFHFTTVRTG